MESFPTTKNICRTCVSTSDPISSIETTFISSNTREIPILEILNLFTDVKVNENYPHTICTNCVEKATNAYQFRLQCDESTRTFTALSEQKLMEMKEPPSPLPYQDSSSDDLDHKPKLKDMSNNIFKKSKRKNRSPKKRPSYKEDSDIESEREEKLDDLDGIGKAFCSQCNKSFKNKYILSAHVKRHQYKGHFLCNVCGKGFNSQSCLIRHTRVHTGEKNYQCEICLKRFPSSNNLKLHSRIHSGIKPYLCNVCGKSFSHPSGLTYHTRTHTKERPCKCDLCGKAFAIQCHLDRHRKTHTGERPFPCKLCVKAFTKKIDLQRHEAVHAGLKPHVCNVCNKAFSQKIHLSYHLMMHNKERPHVCPVCGKGFIRRYYLKDHINKRHGTLEAYDVQENND